MLTVGSYCHFLVFHGYGWHYIVISWCFMVTVGIILSFLSVSWLRLALYCQFLVFDGYGWHHIVISVVFDGDGWNHIVISWCLMVTVGIILSFLGV